MRDALRPGVFVLVWLAMATASNAASLHIEVDRDTLQGYVDTLFPMLRVEPLLSVSLQEPEVLLRRDSDRIGMRVAIVARFPDNLEVSGSAVVDGLLRYVPREGTFYLDESRVRALTVGGMSEAVTNELRMLSESLLAEVLAATPVYRLDVADRNSGSKLEKVSVRDGKLVLDLAMK